MSNGDRVSIWEDKKVLQMNGGDGHTTCECPVSESESHSVASDSLQPMDYTVHGILQTRILEWVAFPFSR